MRKERRLCRDEFERVFLSLYPALCKATSLDAVHSVFLAVVEGELWRDVPARTGNGNGRGTHQIKTWFLGLVKQEAKDQYRKEKQEFGSRRIHEMD